MDSNHRPSGYEPDELPLLHPACAVSAPAAVASNHAAIRRDERRITCGDAGRREGAVVARLLSGCEAAKERGEWNACAEALSHRMRKGDAFTI